MAITQADYAYGTASDPPPSVAYNSAISIGDVLICEVYLTESTSPGTQTVSDSVNSGNWSLLNSQEDAGSGSGLFIFWKVANATGTPTVSISQSSAQYGQLNIVRYTGFVGTPTADASLATNKFTSASTTAVSCTPITTGFNNELLIGCIYTNNQSYTSPTITNWTAVNGATYTSELYYSVVSTAGTNNSFVGTLGVAAAWQAIFAGIYDLVATQYNLVGTGTAVGGFNVTLSPVVPSAAVAGNLLLMQTSISVDSTAPPLISGWTQLSPDASPATLTSIALYGKIATGPGGAGSGDNPSFTWGNIQQDAYIVAYSGNPNSILGIVAASAFQYTGATSTNSVAYPALTVPQNNCLVIAGGTRIKTTAANGSTWNTFGSFTVRQYDVQAGNTIASVMNDWRQTTAANVTAGSQTYSGTDSSAELYQGYVLALGNGPAVGGPLPRLLYIMP